MDKEIAPAELAKNKIDASAASEATPASNAVNSVYDTAEFHIYVRKIISCSKRFAHEWTTCPFAHPGEKAKRRDPRTHQYDCEMCPAVVKGEVCELGAACPHSHHVFESWLHPQKFRTMLCKDGEACHREVCFFAHGAEQLRVPSRDMPLAGPSRLRGQSASRQEQEGLARQASAGVAAAVGNSHVMLPSPQAAALSAAMAAAQFNATGAGNGNSGGRHAWFAPLQQARVVPAGQQGATCNMIMGSSCSNVLQASAPGTNSGTQGGVMGVLPYADGIGGLSGAASGDLSRLQASGVLTSTGNNSSGCWSMSLLPGQQDGDSRRSSLCESCTSGMVIVPTMMQTVPVNSTEHPAGRVLQSQQQGAAAATNGLAGMNDINVLLSSLVQEIKTTRQEAANSRSAAAQAQEQLRAITSALTGAQSTAMLDTAAPAAAFAAAMPSGLAADVEGTAATAAGGDSTNVATQDQLQRGADMLRGIMGNAAVLSSAVPGAGSLPDQLALLQQLQSVGLMPSDPAALSSAVVNGESSMLMGCSDGSNMSTSSSWRFGPGGVFNCAASAGAAPTGNTRGSFETARTMSCDPAALPRGGSLDQATAAAAAAMAAAATASTGSCGLSCQANGVPAAFNPMLSSYPIAAGNAGPGSVTDWLQLLPAASGIDAAAAAGLMPQVPSWRSSMDNSSRAAVPAGGGSATIVAMSSSNTSMQQQQQQLQSDYLLQLQRTHGLLSAPELALFAPTGHARRDGLQQQQYHMQSASAALQGWGRPDMQDCINSSDTMEGLISTGNNVAAHFNATGGARQLGWL